MLVVLPVVLEVVPLVADLIAIVGDQGCLTRGHQCDARELCILDLSLSNMTASFDTGLGLFD